MTKSYWGAIKAATQLVNMPNPQSNPTKFIVWSEDICELIGAIYDEDYDDVIRDFQTELGLLDEDEAWITENS